jgi:hypothetical protein
MAKKGSTPWNKGMKGTPSPWFQGMPGAFQGRHHSEETRLRLSAVARERKFGGYTQGSGVGKKGWYQGFFCDSSWELAFVIYCLDHNISIRRNTEKRQYTWQGKRRNYIPDFVVNGVITEIKGFDSEQWQEKIRENPDVVVMYETDMLPILEYVKSKYGKNFVELYE